MPITNPCSWFSGGGSVEDIKEFTYPANESGECAKFLWHFSPRTNNLSITMETNIVWFADDVKSAFKILRDMCVFRLECARKQSKYYRNGSKSLHAEEFGNETIGAANAFQSYIDCIDSGKCVITIAPVNQFYEVGWASNDTLR